MTQPDHVTMIVITGIFLVVTMAGLVYALVRIGRRLA